MRKRTLAGIDVGTTKICSVIARIGKEGFRVSGVGVTPSSGLKKGIVVNLTETIESVKRSLDQAEQDAQVAVDSVFVSVGGVHVQGLNRAGRTEIRSKTGEVGKEDISRALDDAKSIQLPRDYEIIHMLTQGFTVDGQGHTKDPLGLVGRRLSVNLHLVLNAAAALQNVVNAVNKVGVGVNGVVMQQLASAEAVLTEDEKELGVILLDIGGGTTDFAFYRLGSIWESAVLPMGGDLVTKDIAIGLKMTLEEAERLKKNQGTVFPERVDEEAVLEIREIGTGLPRSLLYRDLCRVIQARCREILLEVRKLVDGIHMRREMLTGVVLTGGGALLDGLAEQAEEILEMPARVGYPMSMESEKELAFDPSHATALGLVRYATDMHGPGSGNGAGTMLPEPDRGKRGGLMNWFLRKIT